MNDHDLIGVIVEDPDELRSSVEAPDDLEVVVEDPDELRSEVMEG